MKTAISIPAPPFVKAEELAHRLRVSRSELYANAIRALVVVAAMAAIQGCAHFVHPRFSPGTDWKGFIVHDEDGWRLAEGLAAPAWDRIDWSGESPATEPDGVRWYSANLVIEGCERRARDGWPRQRIWQRLALTAPFLFRGRYEGATWSARLVSARPARWPGNWESSSVPLASEGAPIPFVGPLRVGVQYVATLELQDWGLGSRWRVQSMEEPVFAGGRTLIWINPDALPDEAEVGASVSATFRVRSAEWHTFAIGVLYAHASVGGVFASTQYSAELTSIQGVPQ